MPCNLKVHHFHCHHCGDITFDLKEGYEHLRDSHPDIWAAEEDLRVEGEAHGVR